MGDLRRRATSERSEALDTREPLAIRFAGERYEVLAEVLGEYADDARIDPWSITIGVSQAAKMLGFNGREIRSLIRIGRLPARKQKNEWRIPLEAVL
ncbi:MAG: helix-turn-helix domain-containing protein [Dehalococcoidia bacterium]